MAESLIGAVRECLEQYPINHEFGLWDLKRDIFKRYPESKHTHGDTVSRRLREARYGKGYQIVCINPAKSRYKKQGTEIEINVKSRKSEITTADQQGWLW